MQTPRKTGSPSVGDPSHPSVHGVGIGLSVCRRLLRAEGGWIDPPDFRSDGGCPVRVGLREAS